MVKIVIDNVYCRIIGFLPDPVHKEISDTLSFKVEGARYMKKVKQGKWDGVVRLYHRHDGQYFYTGLLAFVREILKKHNIEFEKIDNRKRPPINMPELKFNPPPNYEERDYQKFAVDRSLKFTRGVLEIATGGGKTMVVAKLISEIKTYPFVFYVLTKDLMEQAHRVLSETLNTTIGRIGDGMLDIRKINVCTIQTAVRALNYNNPKFKISDYQFDDLDEWDETKIENMEKLEQIKKLIQEARGVYVDECHHVSSKTCEDVLSGSSSAFWRFGGSATPYRESGDEIKIQAMFGSKIVEISASYLIKKGYLVKPYIIFVPVDTDIKFHSYQKVYEHAVSKNDVFNRGVAELANHMVANGLSVIILVQHYPQGDFLKTLIPNSDFITSRMTSEQRTESLEKLRTRERMVVIGTSLLDEGVDVPSLDVIIMAGGGKSCTRVNQRVGRTLRKQKGSNKERSIVIIYDHYDVKFLKKHTIKTKRLLKKEKEFQIIDSKGTEFICDEVSKILGKKNHNNLFEL